MDGEVSQLRSEINGLKEKLVIFEKEIAELKAQNAMKRNEVFSNKNSQVSL